MLTSNAEQVKGVDGARCTMLECASLKKVGATFLRSQKSGCFM